MTNPAAMALSDATASVELGYLGLNPGNMTNVFNLSAFLQYIRQVFRICLWERCNDA